MYISTTPHKACANFFFCSCAANPSSSLRFCSNDCMFRLKLATPFSNQLTLSLPPVSLNCASHKNFSAPPPSDSGISPFGSRATACMNCCRAALISPNSTYISPIKFRPVNTAGDPAEAISNPRCARGRAASGCPVWRKMVAWSKKIAGSSFIFLQVDLLPSRRPDFALFFEGLLGGRVLAIWDVLTIS
ncbi:hypothetical protein I7I53_09597 [Histoplasma capsulatum var. duboisii H88]|uniref:Uncharacterized protein n=1 Tax=Ajellomyces capsulatus (strain H88) TaxID=544711 RepID=A0A8A1L716_AJEC8|nr:hypothetical protein I7I53_09597 [Histoplasma capsulatum var. duboisii H88]